MGDNALFVNYGGHLEIRPVQPQNGRQKFAPYIFSISRSKKYLKNQTSKNEHRNRAKHGFHDISTCTITSYT